MHIVPPEDSYKAANEQKYHTTHEREKYATQPGKISKLERFRERCQSYIPPAQTVLDIGGGAGIWMDVIREMGLAQEIHAIDISPAILKERNPLDIVRVGDMEHLPYKDHTFDGAFFFAALHHVRKTTVALEEAFRVVKPGGFLVLYEPISLRMRFHSLGIEPTPDGVEFCFSLPYIRKSLAETHWKITAIHSEGFLRRFVRQRTTVEGRKKLARIEEKINQIPILRSLFGFFANHVLVIAKKA
jgi:ubiquinone/menaquinone biosynthesis C-methylase UbiE